MFCGSCIIHMHLCYKLLSVFMYFSTSFKLHKLCSEVVFTIVTLVTTSSIVVVNF